MKPPENNIIKLDELKSQNPFQVPENYFDSLGSRIVDRIETGAPKKERVFEIKPILVFAGGFACLALVIQLAISVMYPKTGEGKKASLELAEYSIASELDEATLIETLSQENTPVTDSILQVNQENIITYLVKEDIDLSNIIEEL